MLNIVFGATKCHQYLYGQTVTVETGHKPLESLFKKPLSLVPPRIQRMMLKVQKYGFEVIYKPGKDMYITDTLSRKLLKTVEPQENLQEYTVFVIDKFPVSQEIMSRIRHESENDTVLIRPKEIILKGWPEIKQDRDPSIMSFWNYRDELSYLDGLLLKSERIIIPKAMRVEMINKIHNTSHLGVQRCLRRARDIVFWPGRTVKKKKKKKKKRKCCKVCNL